MKKWLRKKQKFLCLKIKGSSILEVTTAMVLVGIIFIISTMIYFNLITSNKSRRQLKAEQLLNHLVQENIANKQFLDGQYSYGTFTIYQQVESYKQNKNLFWFRLEARDADGKIIADYNQLVYEPRR